MPPPIHRSMTPAEWALLIVLALLWGGSYFYVAIAVKALPPLVVVTFRVVVGAFLLYLVVRATGATMPRDRATWGAFFVMGFINNVVPFNLIAWGQIISRAASRRSSTPPRRSSAWSSPI